MKMHGVRIICWSIAMCGCRVHLVVAEILLETAGIDNTLNWLVLHTFSVTHSSAGKARANGE